MATFYTDSDLTGAGEFVEAEVNLATEFTVPAGSATRFRWRWPTITPAVTPQIRVYDSGGTLIAGPISFDTTTVDAWNWATPGSPVALTAGTYRVAVNTTRYRALGGFFTAGSIVRGDITGIQSRFASGTAVPTSTSTATYYADIDFTASAAAVVPDSLAVPAALGAPAASVELSTAPDSLAAPVALGASAASVTGVLPTSLAVPVSLGEPAIRLVTHPEGLAVPVALGAPTVRRVSADDEGSWNGLLTALNYAREEARVNAERRRHPVECPYDGWPLQTGPRGELHCKFGGHVITPSY